MVGPCGHLLPLSWGDGRSLFCFVGSTCGLCTALFQCVCQLPPPLTSGYRHDLLSLTLDGVTFVTATTSYRPAALITTHLTCPVSTHGRRHVLLWLTESSSVVLICMFFKVLHIQPVDSPVPLFKAIVYSRSLVRKLVSYWQWDSAAGKTAVTLVLFDSRGQQRF